MIVEDTTTLTPMIFRILILISLACFVRAWTNKEVEDFKGFMKKYGFRFNSETEEFDRRMKIFEDNLKAINDIKGKGYGGQYGINKFSAMAPEEFQRMLIPITFDPKEHEDKIPKVKPDRRPRQKRQNIPDSFDYRDYGWVSPVKNQGSCGSCWAFTAAALFESNYLIYGGYDMDFSEQCLVDCNTKNFGCNGGWLNYAIDYIQDYGLVLEANYPYVGTQSNGTCLTGCQATFKNMDYWLIESEADIPYYIYHFGPVGFYFAVPSAFQYYTGGVFDVDYCNNTVGLHEVTIVGYTPDYWIVKNSWGTYWGDQGYVYYKRDKNLCRIETQLIATSIA